MKLESRVPSLAKRGGWICRLLACEVTHGRASTLVCQCGHRGGGLLNSSGEFVVGWTANEGKVRGAVIIAVQYVYTVITCQGRETGAAEVPWNVRQ